MSRLTVYSELASTHTAHETRMLGNGGQLRVHKSLFMVSSTMLRAHKKRVGVKLPTCVSNIIFIPI
jgi:hypothetical protein